MRLVPHKNLGRLCILQIIQNVMHCYIRAVYHVDVVFRASKGKDLFRIGIVPLFRQSHESDLSLLPFDIQCLRHKQVN